jgi:hypothetical protein
MYHTSRCALWRDSVILAVERVYTPGARLVGGLSLPSSLYTYLHTLYIYYLIQIHLRGFGVLGFWGFGVLGATFAPIMWRFSFNLALRLSCCSTKLNGCQGDKANDVTVCRSN